ncbi:MULTISPECIES: carbohydrate kinase family protein [Rhodobacterales]|nr:MULTISPECIES: carbohydrate kinase family protein [Rhodobacterales]
MHVVGGVYQEVCLRPAWNALFGSGGRAAMSIAALSDEVVLHCYFEDASSLPLDSYRDHGIQLSLTRRDSGIAFAYFHPLSAPHLHPPISIQHEPIQVRGEAVLRFGFIEGDAIVSAKRAVFDPQGTKEIQDFFSNGSSAEQLALVLNEAELNLRASGATLIETAGEIIRRKQANVVVIKRGIRGATVVDALERSFDVPSFRSPTVFKIGTGDVFSALFAFFWAKQGQEPETAAYRASAGVAIYADTKRLPLRSTAHDYNPVTGPTRGRVQVVGARDTLGRHYVFEEAKHRLRELGVAIQGDLATGRSERPSAILIIADGLSQEAVQTILASHKNIPVVLLDEVQAGEGLSNLHVECTVSDFTTALYHAAWATMV